MVQSELAWSAIEDKDGSPFLGCSAEESVPLKHCSLLPSSDQLLGDYGRTMSKVQGSQVIRRPPPIGVANPLGWLIKPIVCNDCSWVINSCLFVSDGPMLPI